MATFPKLKTDAVAQYPAKRVLRFQNQTLRFLDGTEQRYRDSGRLSHRWEISLSKLDDGEMSAVSAFLESNQGAFGSFAFVDPWDAAVYENCSFESDQLDLMMRGEMNGETRLTVVENRG